MIKLAAKKSVKVVSDQFTDSFRKFMPGRLALKNIVFVCIGTDRSTGDSFGPLVGTFLTEMGYPNVVGTLDDPVHALNLVEKLKTIDKRKKIIAIDACLGQLSSVGTIQVINGPLKPGAGVNKELPAVGDYSIHGIVNVGGFMEYFVLQNTQLSLVMRMAKDAAKAINSRFPLPDLMEVAVAKEA